MTAEAGVAPIHQLVRHEAARDPTAPVTRKGFRIFFLGAAAFAILALPAWLLSLSGELSRIGWNPVAWHRHEMIFGFTSAVIAGFLLTAVSNWTGRETLVGRPLAALFGLWATGRVLMAVPTAASGLAAAVDAAFLPALAIAIARPLASTGNRRNYVMIAILLVLGAANVATHLEALGIAPGLGGRAALFAVDVITVLMLLIGGRVIPMFTRNATGRESVRSIPPLDRATLGAMAVLAIATLLWPTSPILGTLAILVGLLAAARTSTWGGITALRDPMLWVLHLGHAWIVLGLLLRGISVFLSALPPSLALHAVTVGGIGLLTVGMMSRVTLGHTGRPIRAPAAATWAFTALSMAVPLRLLPALVPGAALSFWILSGVLWTVAFALYLGAFGPMLLRPRADGRPG